MDVSMQRPQIVAVRRKKTGGRQKGTKNKRRRVDTEQPPQVTGQPPPTIGKKTKKFFVTVNEHIKTKMAVPLTRENFSRWLICNEMGFEQDHEHSHMYLETAEKKSYEEIKTILSEKFNITANDIDAVKNEKHCFTYLTKEDKEPLAFGIDKDYYHINYKTSYLARKRKIDVQAYPYRSMPGNYIKRLREEHSAHWGEHYKDEEWKLAMDYKNNDLEEMICDQVEDVTRGGIYIFGKAGTGKTTSVKCALSTDYFEINARSLCFPLNSYNSEKHLIWDEFKPETDFDGNRKLILDIAGKMCFNVERKHGQTEVHMLEGEGKLLMTSNMPPPEDEGFKRRFFIIEVNDEGKPKLL
ncbi:MAG: putative replication-associated protein [Circular genetic element sp.]|nr:MAG: putative replication-associated protein [Circular genetic element sp.]